MTNNNKDDLLKILDEETLAGENMCNIGKITRLINVLNGYYEDIIFEISDNEQIGNIVSYLRNKHIAKYGDDNIEILKKEIYDELKSRNIDNKIIEEWIGYL
jgi:hypothetical protein